MGLYPNQSRAFRYRDPSRAFGADSIPYSSWPSVKMVKRYTQDQRIATGVNRLIQWRNLVSISRLFLAISLEVVRIVQAQMALSQLKTLLAGDDSPPRAGCSASVAPASDPAEIQKEIDSIKAKQLDAAVKLLQNGCNFLKLVGKLAFEKIIPFSFGVDEQRGAVFGCIAQAIGIHRNWPHVRNLEKKHAEALAKKGATPARSQSFDRTRSHSEVPTLHHISFTEGWKSKSFNTGPQDSQSDAQLSAARKALQERMDARAEAAVRQTSNAGAGYMEVTEDIDLDLSPK